MSDNLFARLFKYRSRPNRRPEEDFFSEAFAGVLERYPALARSLFEELTGKAVISVLIDTQVSISRHDGPGLNRIDLRLLGRDTDDGQHLLFIESKLGASEGPEQLARYKSALQSLGQYDSRTLCYLTVKGERAQDITGDGIKFTARRWSEVYEHLRSHGRGLDLVEELLAFMEELGMTREISMNELLAGVTYMRSVSRIWRLLDDGWSGFSKAHRFVGKFSSYYDNANCYYSPRQPETQICVYFGIWFDTSDPEDLDLEFDDPEIPLAYLALWRPNGAQTFFKEHEPYFQHLLDLDEGWKNMPLSDNYVIKRAMPIGAPGAKGATEQMDEFFRVSFERISDAPFLNEKPGAPSQAK